MISKLSQYDIQVVCLSSEKAELISNWKNATDDIILWTNKDLHHYNLKIKAIFFSILM